MQEYASLDGACQTNHLRAAGFTDGEIFGYADDARAILSGRPNAGRKVLSVGRKQGLALVAEAKRIRARKGGRHG